MQPESAEAPINEGAQDHRRTLRAEIASGFATSLPLMLAGWAIVLSFLWLGQTFGIPFADFSRDPLAVAENGMGVSWYYGALSNLGVLVWTAAAAMSWLMGLASAARDRTYWWLAAGLSGVLTVDDLFQLHDRVVPQLTGSRDDWLIAGHALLAGIFMIVCRDHIRRSPYGIALWATFWLALSVLEDVLGLLADSAGGNDAAYVVEDGSKFVGAVLWASYLAITARNAIQNRPGAEAVPVSGQRE